MVKQLLPVVLLLAFVRSAKADTLAPVRLLNSGFDCGATYCGVASVSLGSYGAVNALPVYVGTNANLAGGAYQAEVLVLGDDAIGITEYRSSLPGNVPFAYSTASASGVRYLSYLSYTDTSGADELAIQQASLCLSTAGCALSSLSTAAQGYYTEAANIASYGPNLLGYGDVVAVDANGQLDYEARPVYEVWIGMSGYGIAGQALPDAPAPEPTGVGLAAVGLLAVAAWKWGRRISTAS